MLNSNQITAGTVCKFRLDVPSDVSRGKDDQILLEGKHAQGRIQDFHIGGGGGQKIMCQARTLRARNRTHFRQGSRARLNFKFLRALEALGLFYCSLVLSEPYIFKYPDI